MPSVHDLDRTVVVAVSIVPAVKSILHEIVVMVTVGYPGGSAALAMPELSLPVAGRLEADFTKGSVLNDATGSANMTREPEIRGVATNVVTGFLGVGKTTAIRHLLRQKPGPERWAVLVNEFGEIGVDGSLLAGGKDLPPGVSIREVPGGCMCCTAGVPMKVALNALLVKARPRRLLIEPTGLGHPREVLMALAADSYREVIDLRATVALVDARKARDPRYTSHDTFRQQLDVADIIVANKSDRYGPEDLSVLKSFLEGDEGLDGRPLHEVRHGALELEWLQAKARRYRPPPPEPSHDHATPEASTPRPPPGGHLRIDNEGEGYFSTGWVFDGALSFDPDALRELLGSVRIERAKGSVITKQGNLAFNLADGAMAESALGELAGSRIELIGLDRDEISGLEGALLACVSKRRTDAPS